jgi:hypothetical protein
MKGLGKHHDHDYALIEEAIKKYRKEVEPCLDPMEVMMKKALTQINAQRGEISHQQALVRDSIYIIFRRLQKVIHARETELIRQLDVKTQDVQYLNSDLTFCNMFGEEGPGLGQFKYPWGIACDSAGKVHVADSGNHRIQIFTVKEIFLMMFSDHKGRLNFPVSVAISDSMVYVSESNNHCISVFSSCGHFVTSFVREGGNTENMYTLMD